MWRTTSDWAPGFTTRFYSKNWQFRDTLSWIRGRHNFKFGYEMLKLQFRQVFIGSPGFTFNGSHEAEIQSPISCWELSTTCR